MWRFALLCSVVTLTVACADGPGAPSKVTDGLSLQRAGDPPPPPLDGGGNITLGPSDAFAAATEIGTQQEPCVAPVFEFIIEGRYFHNKSGSNTRIHFKPVPGSGSGTIRETTDAPPFDQEASGTLVVESVDGQKHEVHLVDYTGPLLDFFFSGGTSGILFAEVNACGEPTEYSGQLNFDWTCLECKDGF
jgi:hypothetical protein